MRIERPLLITVLMLALCGPARAQFPSASPSAATKPKESDVPLRKPPPQDDVDVRVEDMKLLEPGIGWAELSVDLPSELKPENVIYWTTDNGKHWRNITPPRTHKEHLSAFFFLDTHHGWALFDWPEEELKAEEVANLRKLRLSLAATSDGGATWSKTPLTLRLADYFTKEGFSGLNSVDEDSIAFADQLHGWLLLPFSGFPHVQESLLLITSDGGNIWREANNDPGPGSPQMLPVTPNEGWLSGAVGPDYTTCLFVTRDGTKSWQGISTSLSESCSPDESHEMFVQPSENFMPGNCDVYGLPIFQDPTHGFLEEDCVSDEAHRDNSTHTTVLFATTDGGRTWKEDRMLRNFAGLCNSSTVVDSVWIAPVKHGGHLVLLRVEAGATLDAGKDNGSNSQDSTLCDTRLSFVTPAQGWMLADHSVLQSTTDGGRTWTTLTPGRNRR